MTSALALTLASSRAGLSQDRVSTDRIAWSAARKLRWQDFAGTPPRGADGDCHSFVGLNVDWSCDDNHFVFHVSTTFDPIQSWVRPGARQPDLLRHEQTHFDLTEVAARKLRQRVAALGDPCASYAEIADVDNAVGDERGAWEREQQLYDRETANGTNLPNQQGWTTRTAQRLEQLKGFE